MADKNNGGKLVSVTAYGGLRKPNTKESLAKDSVPSAEFLNAMDAVTPELTFEKKSFLLPNLQNKNKPAKKKTKTVKTASSVSPNAQDATGDVIDWFKKNVPGSKTDKESSDPEDINKLIQGLASSDNDVLAEMLAAYQDSLETPNYKPYRAPGEYRFPGYFQG